MRPIEQKLKYQVEKLVKIAATGGLGKLSSIYAHSASPSTRLDAHTKGTQGRDVTTSAYHTIYVMFSL